MSIRSIAARSGLAIGAIALFCVAIKVLGKKRQEHYSADGDGYRIYNVKRTERTSENWYIMQRWHVTVDWDEAQTEDWQEGAEVWDEELDFPECESCEYTLISDSGENYSGHDYLDGWSNFDLEEEEEPAPEEETNDAGEEDTEVYSAGKKGYVKYEVKTSISGYDTYNNIAEGKVKVDWEESEDEEWQKYVYIEDDYLSLKNCETCDILESNYDTEIIGSDTQEAYVEDIEEIAREDPGPVTLDQDIFQLKTIDPSKEGSQLSRSSKLTLKAFGVSKETSQISQPAELVLKAVDEDDTLVLKADPDINTIMMKLQESYKERLEKVGYTFDEGNSYRLDENNFVSSAIHSIALPARIETYCLEKIYDIRLRSGVEKNDYRLTIARRLGIPKPHGTSPDCDSVEDTYKYWKYLYDETIGKHILLDQDIFQLKAFGVSKETPRPSEPAELVLKAIDDGRKYTWEKISGIQDLNEGDIVQKVSTIQGRIFRYILIETLHPLRMTTVRTLFKPISEDDAIKRLDTSGGGRYLEPETFDSKKFDYYKLVSRKGVTLDQNIFQLKTIDPSKEGSQLSRSSKLTLKAFGVSKETPRPSKPAELVLKAFGAPTNIHVEDMKYGKTYIITYENTVWMCVFIEKTNYSIRGIFRGIFDIRQHTHKHQQIMKEDALKNVFK